MFSLASYGRISMSDPVPYEPSYSFSGFQASNPSTPLPAPKVDNEFAKVQEAIEGLVAAVKDVRRSDGGLKNQSVNYETLSLALQLTFDPTNGELVAAAVEGAETSAATALAAKNDTLALKNDAQAAAEAAEEAASGINLTLYMPKAGNFAGIGNPAVARGNIGAANVDSSDLEGRLATVTGETVTDWNDVKVSGWSAATSAANAPGSGYWLVQTTAFSGLWVTQVAYSFMNAATSTSAVRVMRRHSYSNSGAIAWQPWESMSPMPVGQTIYVSGTTAPPGTVKENGALLLRADFPRLWVYAVASGNITSEAGWTAGNSGAFSTGDLLTTFRIPDARAEFIRAFDDGRGVDSGRFIQARQADTLKDHKHGYGTGNSVPAGDAGSITYLIPDLSIAGSGVLSPNNGGTETRPRNIAKLACLVY